MRQTCQVLGYRFMSDPSFLRRLSGGLWRRIVSSLSRHARSDILFIPHWEVPPGSLEDNYHPQIGVDGCNRISSAEQDFDEGVADTHR